MKIGKYNNDEMLLVECEGGREVGGDRTVDDLYADGYKDVCEVQRPSATAICAYQDYGVCFVQVWQEPTPDPDPDEITAEEALQIITGE